MKQELKEKIISYSLVSIVYIFALITINQLSKILLFNYGLYNIVVIIAWALSILGLYKQNLFVLRLSTLLTLFIGAGASAIFIVWSMLKGIELVSGIQPHQHGLINTVDATYATVGFVITVVALYVLSTYKLKIINNR